MERRFEKYNDQYESRMNVEMRRGFVSTKQYESVMDRKGISYFISSTTSHMWNCVYYQVGCFIKV